MCCKRILSRHLVTLVAWLAVGQVLLGQDVPTEADPELAALNVTVGKFFEGISTGPAKTAYQQLLTGSRLAEQDQARRDLIAKTEQLSTKYGQYCGYEQIAAKTVGDDLVLFRYLYKCKHFPVVWYFAFYRATVPGESPEEDRAWRLITVRFDTELELLAFLK